MGGLRLPAGASPLELTAAAREFTPSISKIRDTCRSTVRALRNSSSAISRFVLPAATNSMTSS
jgi:hypothetical protein